MPNLLIIQTSSLGDIVQSLQVASALKAQQPEWTISWVVRDLFAPFVRMSTVVDQLFVFRRLGGVRGFWRLIRELREKQFDVVMDMHGLLRSGLITRWSGGTRRIGRADAREGATIFYREKIPLPAGGRASHPLEILLQFCPAVGAKPELAGPLKMREIEHLNLAFMAPHRGQRPILIFPDSRRADKKWNGFGQFTALLIREAGRKAVWAGTDYIPCKEAFPEGTFVNLTGNTSLTSLSALIAKADWVVSNDSGPMHLAAALGVKTVGLFGPTDPRATGPYPINSPTNYAMQAPVGDLSLLPAREAFARFQRIQVLARKVAGPAAALGVAGLN
ncbi:MAG: glycosyltransferase family 9 protein [Opitutae bacterium]|nr:glycosyltransferase family 9 protein [Opitutae bacterium]